MKHVLALFCLLLSITYLSAQNTNVIINGQGVSQSGKNSIYYVNGISSTEDIGGVTAYFENFGVNASTGVRERIKTGESYYDPELYYIFENCNSFPVTVVFEGKWGEEIRHSGTLTLKAYEKKKYLAPTLSAVSKILTITRRLGQTKDPVTELKRYKELLDANIITQEEFNKKKKELLGY